MTNQLQPEGPEAELLTREREFFDALVENDLPALQRILAEDFTLTDLSGSQMTKDQFLSLLEAGQLKFLSITPQGGTRVRGYGMAAVVAGRTIMELRFMGELVSVESRYTHVYAIEDGVWRLEVAQGTPIQSA